MVEFRITIGFFYNEEGQFFKASIQSAIVQMVEALEEQSVCRSIIDENEFGLMFIKEFENEIEALKWAKGMEKNLLDNVPDSPVEPNERTGITIEPVEADLI